MRLPHHQWTKITLTPAPICVNLSLDRVYTGALSPRPRGRLGIGRCWELSRPRDGGLERADNALLLLKFTSP